MSDDRGDSDRTTAWGPPSRGGPAGVGATPPVPGAVPPPGAPPPPGYASPVPPTYPPPGAPGGPPPGGFPPAAPPPGGTPGTPGLGGAPAPKRSKAPIVIAAVVFVAIVGAGIAAALVLFGGGEDGDAKAREDFAAAAAEGDAAAIRALAEERPELLEATERITVAEASELDPGEEGVVVASVALDSGTEYTVAVDGRGSPGLVVLDGDRDQVDIEPRLVSEGGTHTVVVGGPNEVTVTVVPVLVGEADVADEQVTELAAPGQIVELTVEVFGGDIYEAALLDGAGYVGRILDADGVEVVTLPDGGDYVRFHPQADAEYLLVLEAPDGSEATSVTTDVLALARWVSYAGEEGDDFFLAEEIEPDSIRPFNDPLPNALAWCFDLLEGVTLEVEFRPTLPGSVWELRSFESEGARIAGDALTTFDDVTETSVLTIEAEDGDTTFCYEMRITSAGSSAMDLTITEA